MKFKTVENNELVDCWPMPDGKVIINPQLVVTEKPFIDAVIREKKFGFQQPVFQWVGRQDKNGKDIYEGHKLLIRDEHEGVMKWSKGNTRYAINSETLSGSDIDLESETEIIGHTHIVTEFDKLRKYIENLVDEGIMSRQNISEVIKGSRFGNIYEARRRGFCHELLDIISKERKKIIVKTQEDMIRGGYVTWERFINVKVTPAEPPLPVNSDYFRYLYEILADEKLTPQQVKNVLKYVTRLEYPSTRYEKAVREKLHYLIQVVKHKNLSFPWVTSCLFIRNNFFTVAIEYINQGKLCSSQANFIYSQYGDDIKLLKDTVEKLL